MVEFTIEMVIGNEELNLIILTQFYSIIACYVFYYFVIYVFLQMLVENIQMLNFYRCQVVYKIFQWSQLVCSYCKYLQV